LCNIRVHANINSAIKLMTVPYNNIKYYNLYDTHISDIALYRASSTTVQALVYDNRWSKSEVKVIKEKI